MIATDGRDEGNPSPVAFSADGRRAAVVGYCGEVIVFLQK